MMNPSEPPPGLCDDLDVLAFASARQEQGEAVALATIVGVEGPFSRPLGAQLAVTAGGDYRGSISGGCLEQALVEEAQQAIETRTSRFLRYGVGSPFVDVRLPCGGGLDIYLDAAPDPEVLKTCCDLARERTPFRLAIPGLVEGDRMAILAQGSAAISQDHGRLFQPRLCVLAAGRGWELVALSALCRAIGVEAIVASQEASTREICTSSASRVIPLTTPDHLPDFALDASTAVACLFHEHEWDAPVISAALQSDAFYIGALGSQKTHAQRLVTLEALGHGASDLARLSAPIGLFRAQAPQAVAVSVISEILARRTGNS